MGFISKTLKRTNVELRFPSFMKISAIYKIKFATY